MRWKFERDNYEEHKCFLCLHVRTGTLLLGLLHLLFYTLAIFFLLGTFAHPEWVQFKPQGTPLDRKVAGSQANKTSTDNGTHLPAHSTKEFVYDNILILLLLSIGSLTITIFLVYGTLTGKPQYITPFFCIQVFTLCLSGMTMLGYFSDIPDLKKWISSLPSFPMKERILLLDNDQLTLLSLIIFVSVLSIMMYCIGVVWGCYKYLKYREVFSSVRIYPLESNRESEDTEMLLPPKYEDVIRMSLEEAPPPAYCEN